MPQRAAPASAETNKPVAPNREEFHVDPRLMVKTICVSLRSEINKVLKTFIILREKNQIVVWLFAGGHVRALIKPAAGSDKGLISDDRTDARFAHCHVESDRPKHVSQVRKGARFHLQFLQPF